MKSHFERRDKRRYCHFIGNTATTRKNVVIYSIKLKTSSDMGTCVGMSATNPHFPLADLLEIYHPDSKVQSKSKSMLSSGGQPRAVTTSRRARLMRALRTKIKNSHGAVHGGKAPISIQRHYRTVDPQLAQGGRLDLSPAHDVSDPSTGRRGEE
ncbi:hypothetical protein BHE74_00017453 [Ensete ventricosum]|nr:hypothetical protein GW17_00051573 [Ensete ventricosum]RWW74605.1 hypothetical protein BHE74_00017453 [Ensete ventricosum]